MFYFLLYKGNKSRNAGVNFINAATKDVWLHVGVRVDESKVVLNACINGQWDHEKSARIEGVNNAFRLDLENATARLMQHGQYIAEFTPPYIIPETKVEDIEIYGPIEMIQCTEGEYPLYEALTSTGYEDAVWLITHFDPEQYTQLNPALQGCFSTSAQALEHFLTAGVEGGYAYAEDNVFDAGFYREFYEDVTHLEDAAAYRHWIKTGKQHQRYGSEASFLRTIDNGFSILPTSFDWEAYRGTLTDKQRHTLNKWELFKQWAESAGNSGSDLIPFRSDVETVQVITLWADQKALKGDEEAARNLYNMAVAFDLNCAFSGRALAHLGDSYVRDHNRPLAISAYQRAIHLGGGYVWAFINIAKSYGILGLYGRAVDAISKACDLFPEHVHARLVHREILNDQFHASRKVALNLAMQGNRAAASQVSIDSVEQYLKDKPAEKPVNCLQSKASTKPRVLIMGTADLAQCLHYRVHQKLEHLTCAGFDVEFVAQNEPAKFVTLAPFFDVAIFYRVPAFPEIIDAIEYARRLGMTLFYEIDDLVFDRDYFPEDLSSYGGLLKPEDYANLVVDVGLFQKAMEMCDYGIASTPSLQAIIQKKVRRNKCYLHRNAFGQLHENLAETFQGKSGTEKQTIDIFYGTGTKAHNEDFDCYAAPAIAAVMRDNEKVRLIIAGYLTLPDELLQFGTRIVRIPPIWDLNIYWREILANADINLAVLKPGLVSDCKSEIKWMEAAMLGVPSLVSATATYREILEDGQTALLANSVEEWEHKLARLVNDSELRQKIARQSWELAWKNYSVARQAENIGEIILDATRERQKAPSARPLILIVNVFFPPQTIGGATRVVRDNVDYFIDHFSKQFDIAVFTSNEGAAEPYQLSCYDYRGVCVTAVSTPYRPRGDWHPFDEAMETVFSDFLQHFRPDLVHFHCVQRLTASILSATRKQAIPYFVTAHDAWWISDYQFLVDEAGKLRLEHSAIDVFQHNDTLAMEGFLRAQKLKAELAGARAVLSVSERFAGIYRQHGVSNVKTISNGLSHLPQVSKKPHADHRVRLGIIGGMQAHKGLPLVRRALLGAGFKNLHLTVVDLAEGDSKYVRRTRYGSTPVNIIGKLPQERIGELYGQLDVLLAVSIWPESYGLVTREALACGLWVVASDRGAIGDDVVEGKNGFVVDVSGTAALTKVLQTIDSDPARYLSAPAHLSVLRSADSQAKELAALYIETLTDAELSKG